MWHNLWTIADLLFSWIVKRNKLLWLAVPGLALQFHPLQDWQGPGKLLSNFFTVVLSSGFDISYSYPCGMYSSILFEGREKTATTKREEFTIPIFTTHRRRVDQYFIAEELRESILQRAVPTTKPGRSGFLETERRENFCGSGIWQSQAEYFWVECWYSSITTLLRSWLDPLMYRIKIKQCFI